MFNWSRIANVYSLLLITTKTVARNKLLITDTTIYYISIHQWYCWSDWKHTAIFLLMGKWLTISIAKYCTFIYRYPLQRKKNTKL